MIYRSSPFNDFRHRGLAQSEKGQYALVSSSCWLVVAILVLLLGSCHHRQEPDELPTIQKPVVGSASRAKPAGPERDAAVLDLLPTRGDTLIAVKHEGGLALTTDAGMHWQHLYDMQGGPDAVFFRSLTIDQYSVLWGLDSWIGMHEPSYAQIASSTDMGKTWLE